tara:strand:+ start:485 stop:736 length:252 start_codon:yes stop_codon:yes gene_type:complete
MSIPASNNKEDDYVQKTVTEELCCDCAGPLPDFPISVQEAAFLRFRVDAILEEWIFPKSGEPIPYRRGLNKSDWKILKAMEKN